MGTMHCVNYHLPTVLLHRPCLCARYHSTLAEPKKAEAMLVTCHVCCADMPDHAAYLAPRLSHRGELLLMQAQVAACCCCCCCCLQILCRRVCYCLAWQAATCCYNQQRCNQDVPGQCAAVAQCMPASCCTPDVLALCDQAACFLKNVLH
jgi:hypothetical protein